MIACLFFLLKKKIAKTKEKKGCQLSGMFFYPFGRNLVTENRRDSNIETMILKSDTFT